MVILNNGGYIDAINLDYVMVTYLYPCGIYYRQDADYYWREDLVVQERTSLGNITVEDGKLWNSLFYEKMERVEF